MDLEQVILVRIDNSNDTAAEFQQALLRMKHLDYVLLSTHCMNYKKQHSPSTFRNFIMWLVSECIAEHVVPEKYYAFETD